MTTSENTGESDNNSLCEFLSMPTETASVAASVVEPTEKLDEKQDDKPDVSKKTITINSKTNYWISDKVKAHKREYRKEYYRRKKQEQQELIESLKDKQIKGATIAILNLSGKQTVRKITTEQNYLKLCDDLLATLQANRIINDYSIDFKE